MNKNNKNTICAVVVTYNRCELLKRVVQALRNQTQKIDTILIINNGSTDSTIDWLEKQCDLTVITQSNLGGSGGFNRGCLYALEKKFDYVWLMDDDGFPSENALEQLLNIPNIGLAVANSFVIDEEKIKLSFPLWYLGKRYDFVKDIKDLNIDYLIGMINPFNGTLIPFEVMELIGVPYGDMFIWGDESEYSSRIIKHNIPVVTVIKSIFIHPLAKEIEGGDWPNNIAWKKYYSTRNLYRTIKNKHNKFVFLRYTKAILHMLWSVIINQKIFKMKKIKMIIMAYYHAITDRFGLLPNQIKVIKYFIENK